MVMGAFSKNKSNFLKYYFQERPKKKFLLKKALLNSYQDVIEDIKNFYIRPGPLEFIILCRNCITSSIWIGRTGFFYFLSLIDFSLDLADPEHDDKTQYILDHVARKKEMNFEDISYEEIFRSIFNELEFAHHNPKYKSKLQLPKSHCTIVLIPGVLNEIFSTPAFSRGAKHISKRLDLKIFAPRIVGTKSSLYNRDLLKDQFHQYIRENPKEKLWILCFSKGGLDALHFVKENQTFASEHILGLSMIASPILGSDNVDHQLLKIVNKIHDCHNNPVYKFFDKKFDLLLKEFQKGLSSEYRAGWFKRNHSLLPRNLFYTAVAFEAQWYNSHFWMVLTKTFFQSSNPNDGVVDARNALFPSYFNGINLGVLSGHHLVGTRSSVYCQEALLEAHLVFFDYLGLLGQSTFEIHQD